MKRLIVYFLILLGSVWLGIKIHKDPGYVLITYQKWSLETTLWFAILAIFLAFFILSLLLRLFQSTTSLSTRLDTWSSQRKTRKAGHLTYQGLCELAEGKWRAAEKDLVKGVVHSEMPLINYLATATAAQHLGEFELRDSYLRSAHHCDPKAEMAIGLTQAQLQLNGKQWELALATLRHLQQLDPKHVYVLKLLRRVYEQLNDWESLRLLLPELHKRKVFDVASLDQLEKKTYLALLKIAVRGDEAKITEKTWGSIPSRLKNDTELVALYITYLMNTHQEVKAETILRETLKNNWNDDLLIVYANLNVDNEKQLTFAESYLKTRSNDPILLCCLGHLCIKNKLWGKARSYLQSSIQLLPRIQTYQELAQFFEQMNEPTLAMDSYRKALRLAI